MYGKVFIISLLLTCGLHHSSHATPVPTPCEIANVFVQAQKVNLQARFSNETVPAEVQQKKLAMEELAKIEQAIQAKDQAQCTMKMLVIKQILDMKPASQTG